MSKVRKGTHVIEFFTNIGEIKKRYESGAVVGRILHEDLQKDGLIKMPYRSFMIFLQKHIIGQKDSSANVSTTTSQNNAIKQLEIAKVHEPLKLELGGSRQVKLGSMREIDPKDKI